MVMAWVSMKSPAIAPAATHPVTVAGCPIMFFLSIAPDCAADMAVLHRRVSAAQVIRVLPFLG